ncbi:MAG: septal ring lytic transglycosylase RlpA family protein [Hormoscilla sp. GUM202]|nr:septal ring lytic transglycosylase RlpA family protein [Hormoscilla sp. GUM202]
MEAAKPMHQKVGKSIATALIVTGIGLSNHLEQTKTADVGYIQKIKATAPRLLSDLADRLTDIVNVEESAKASEASAHPIGRSLEKEWRGYSQKGWASWYGPGLHGNLTANGEIFNQYDLTAAHPNLPFGTWVRVTNLNNNLSVVVRINDRGPYIRGRIIDVSAAAAQEVRMRQSGVVPVRVDVLGR